MATVIPQASTATPTVDQRDSATTEQARTARALVNAAAYVAENGCTPEQATALRKIARIVIADGDPSGAARKVLDLIEDLPQPHYEFETTTLTEDAPLVLRYVKSTGRVHVGWDPRHLTRDEAQGTFVDCATDAGLHPDCVAVPEPDPAAAVSLLDLDQSKPSVTDDDRVTLGEVAGWMSDADARTTSDDRRRMASLANASALTAQERATWDRVVVCEAAMPEGAVILHRKLDNEGAQHVVTWDPRQTSREQVDAFLRMFVGEYVEYTAEQYQALRGITGFPTADPDPKVIAFLDEVEQAVIGAADPFAAVARISELITREHAALQGAQ